MFFPAGQGTISNISLQLPSIDQDLYAQNVVPYPAYTWSRRGGFTELKVLKNNTFNSLHQFLSSEDKDIVFTMDTDVWSYNKNKVVVGGKGIMDAKVQHQFVDFRGVMYFIGKNNTVYTYNGTEAKIATYTPRKYLMATNIISVTNGSPVATFKIPTHGLTPSQTVNLSGFSGTLGGNVLNGSYTIATATTNTFTINYPSNFNTTAADTGGSGIITAISAAVEFPKAASISTLNGRVYLLSSQYPGKIYVSNAIVNTDVYFITEPITTDILNSSIFSSDDAPFIVTAPTTHGIFKMIFASDYGVYLFADRAVYFWGGKATDRLTRMKTDDSIPNIGCVDSDGALVYFLGYNNLYVMTPGDISPTVLGMPHQDYIRLKDNAKARLKFYDNMVICALGDFTNAAKGVKSLKSPDGDSIDFSNISGLALVYFSLNKAFTFFTRFNSSDYEVVSHDEKVQLWFEYNDRLVFYDIASAVDIFDAIPCRILTHIKFGSSMKKRKSLNKMIYYAFKCTPAQVKFKSIDDNSDTDWHSIDFPQLGNDGYQYSGIPKEEAMGRGFIVDIQHFDKSPRFQFEGYDLELSDEKS